MKVLTTAGLTKLIELSKNTFLDKDNVIDVSDALATVAITGSYNDLTNKPTINDLTTSAQQAALNSGATSTNIAQITTNTNNITTINNNISTINDKIPTAATSNNQLADKAFVNSSITSMAANYITSDAQGDNFATKAALLAGPYYHKGVSYTPTNNDYALVESDETKDNATTRYIYDGAQWAYQYIVNDTPFTQAQLDAINSNINSNLVSDYNTHIDDTTIHVTTTDKTNWNNKVDKTTYISKVYVTDASGNQSTLSYSQSNSANSIAQRDVNGQVAVNQTPTANNHAASKKYVDDGLNSKQATLVSGTNIKTINNQSVLGSGNLNLDGLPSQSGQSGKYLTTNGTSASWNSLATVATSGSYNDLSNKLTAGTDINISSSNVISSTYPEVYLTEDQYQDLVDAGTIDNNTYYNTEAAVPVAVSELITRRSSMNPGDQLNQGHLVLVEVQ